MLKYLLCFYVSTLFSGQPLEVRVVKNDPPQWMLSQIKEDLQDITSEEISFEAIDAIISKPFDDNPLLVHFQIVDGIPYSLNSSINIFLSSK